MFKNIGNMGAVLKQAQDMQKKMTDLQAEMENRLVEGKAGGDAVIVVMTVKGVLKSMKIDPSLLNPDEKEILEDLIISAVNDARAKGEREMGEEMEKITGGLNLPAGLKLPF